ncbi:uncharacterized protein LOC118354048 [Canis lupus dingo]|uniref:uncharacterized protein LOC118354048 n=1 Tax=Canis lupus dingo TaxID=286419 RepID=UPI0020C425E7|nr:uncharacterized protein LOC118354048 [Canis lupus dingo]
MHNLLRFPAHPFPAVNSKDLLLPRRRNRLHNLRQPKLPEIAPVLGGLEAQPAHAGHAGPRTPDVHADAPRTQTHPRTHVFTSASHLSRDVGFVTCSKAAGLPVRAGRQPEAEPSRIFCGNLPSPASGESLNVGAEKKAKAFQSVGIRKRKPDGMADPRCYRIIYEQCFNCFSKEAWTMKRTWISAPGSMCVLTSGNANKVHY